MRRPRSEEPILVLGDEGAVYARCHDARFTPALRDFLVSVCEPETRPRFWNTFRMTAASMAAAASEGVHSPDAIAAALRAYSGRGPMDPLPSRIERLLQQARQDQRMQMVLQRPQTAAGVDGDGRGEFGLTTRQEDGGNLAHFLVASSRVQLEQLARRNATIAQCAVPTEGSDGIARLVFSDATSTVSSSSVLTPAPAAAAAFGDNTEAQQTDDDAKRLLDAATATTFKMQLASGVVRQVRRAVQEDEGAALDVVYDVASDLLTPKVRNFRLRDAAVLRPYQQESLRRFCSNGRARNGVVVLPCGAGKSLTGIACAAAVGRPVVVLCINGVSVYQWRDQFLRWTALKEHQVTVCTDQTKQDAGDVFITTYSMLLTEPVEGPDGRMSEDQQIKRRIFAALRERSWGVLLLDEVHGAVARNFQKVFDKVSSHAVLGLTATLLREDERISDLRYLVGPKLYEANWLELATAGHLATVQCVEVRCPMPASYVRAYLRATTQQQRALLETLNPVKLWALQALLAFHTGPRRTPSDKVLIFCDSRAAIRAYARALGLPYMDGDTPGEERTRLLQHFKANPRFNVLVLSRVGDTALDLPEATVAIQVSWLGKSRRQEAQRLGRVLRPKPPSLHAASAFFYTLVSEDTDEVTESASRQAWLTDQGFSFRVVPAATCLHDFWRHRPALRDLAEEDEGFGGGDAVGEASSGPARAGSTCLVPLDRWICISAAHRSTPTWQVRVRAGPKATHYRWVSLPLGMQRHLEESFVAGRGPVASRAGQVVPPPQLGALLGALLVPGMASDLEALTPARIADLLFFSDATRHRAHVLIAGVGAVVFDSADAPNTQGALVVEPPPMPPSREDLAYLSDALVSRTVARRVERYAKASERLAPSGPALMFAPDEAERVHALRCMGLVAIGAAPTAADRMESSNGTPVLLPYPTVVSGSNGDGARQFLVPSKGGVLLEMAEDRARNARYTFRIRRFCASHRCHENDPEQHCMEAALEHIMSHTSAGIDADQEE